MVRFRALLSRCDWTAVVVLAAMAAVASFPSFGGMIASMR
jgi:hypothetical protein